MTRNMISDAVSNISARHIEEAEDFTITKKKKRIQRIIGMAAMLVLSLTLLGFAYGSKIIRLLSGGTLEVGKDYTSMSTSLTTEPAEVRDGQIYFVLDGSNKNITAECSTENYYQYEYTEQSGIRHIILIGGTPENVGWAEFIVLTNGEINMAASYHGEEPAWLVKGKQAIYGFIPGAKD